MVDTDRILRYQIIHYNAGTTIASAYAVETSPTQGWRGLVRTVYASYLRVLQSLELGWVKVLRKTVFVTYQGDDARQGDFTKDRFEISIVTQVDDGYYSDASDRFKRYNIRRMASLAKKIYAVNPDLLHVLPPAAGFVGYSHVFLDEWQPSYTQQEARPLRIVHAPSHRKVKGTEVILAALEQLRREGVDFELILVEGLSNAKARELYASADILIDQLFAGWYGGLAVELMALGKPVVAYIREDDLVFVPSEMRNELPIIRATPTTVLDVFRTVMGMPRDELVALGSAVVPMWSDGTIPW